MQKDTHKEQKLDPNRAMNDMMATIDVVRDLYTRETEALERSDTRAFMALQPEKAAKTNEYKEGIAAILMRKEEMRSADPDLKQKLQDMQADFAQLANKNIKALDRMQRCAERLSNKVRFAAKETAKQRGVFGYQSTGAIHASVDKKPVSIGVSETA